MGRAFLLLVAVLVIAFCIALGWARGVATDLQEKQCHDRASAQARIERAQGDKPEAGREGQDSCRIHDRNAAVKAEAGA